MDTIFALASAQGRAGVAVIRISGAAAVSAVADLCSDVPKVRGLRRLVDKDHALLDEALVLAFEKGHSFTGEDVVELQLHGSVAVVAAVLRVLGDDPRLRLAEPGEFTRRALENGRLDLTEVEGLADLIDAETEGQRRQALRVLSGALGEKAEGWRRQLIRAAALIEATIDFADEEVPVNVEPEVSALLNGVRASLQKESDGVRIAERIREGFEVAIVGAPNVGKSTLLNRLAGREAAITSEIAGTTRDVIEVRMDIDGYPVTILDTAGLRSSSDTVEVIGIERARDRASAADLRIHMVLPGESPLLDMVDGDLIVQAKADLYGSGTLAISGMTGEGVDRLVAEISSELAKRTARVGIAMRERHRVAMQRAVGFLDAAQVGLENPAGMSDLVAEDLRSAVRAIDSLIGRVDVENILDEIFASFCIGK